MRESVVSRLAQVYPQLYLNPDTEPADRFKDVVLKGQAPDQKNLDWYQTDPRDKDEIIQTPAGEVRVITLYVRRDFELFIRSMLAAKEGPGTEVPASQGASTLITINWPRIHAHKEQFLQKEAEAGNLLPDWGAEWKRFTSVKENYLDHLIVLSVGPYSAVDAELAGCTSEEWTELSDTIRKYHELNHVICRKLYPDQINAVWDEVASDAIGLYAAYGRYDPAMARLFLGIEGGQYVGGRLENYTDQPQELVAGVNQAIGIIDQIIREHQGAEPFDLIPLIEQQQINL